MLKGKDLLIYALNKIMPNNNYHAIGVLAADVLVLDDRHKNLLRFVDPLGAYEYVKNEILALDNCDELIIKYLKDHDLPLPIRWAWKHERIQDGKNKIIDESNWYYDKHECYRNMWVNVMNIAQIAIDMSSIEHPLVVTSKDIDWVKFEQDEVIDLFTVYEME